MEIPIGLETNAGSGHVFDRSGCLEITQISTIIILFSTVLTSSVALISPDSPLQAMLPAAPTVSVASTVTSKDMTSPVPSLVWSEL